MTDHLFPERDLWDAQWRDEERFSGGGLDAGWVGFGLALALGLGLGSGLDLGLVRFRLGWFLFVQGLRPCFGMVELLSMVSYDFSASSS